MEYELKGIRFMGASLDDEKQEVRVTMNIDVAISGADDRFVTNNPGIDFVLKGFKDYDDLSTQIKTAAVDWVAENYPNK